MNIIGKRKIWYLFSAVLLIPGIIFLGVYGLNLGIDFTGGSMIEIAEVTDLNQVKEKADEVGLENTVYVESGEQRYMVRMAEITEEKHREFVSSLEGLAREERFESVGPSISRDLTRNAFYSIAVASLAIVLYIAYSFRRIPKPVSSWQFGSTAIVTLVHDTLIVLGIFAILGKYFNIEVDSYFVTAILTIIGFSVHDTIVVFDRIREKLIRDGGHDLERTVNSSVVETIVRSLNTSFTTLLVLVVLYLFGESTIKHFILALMIGTVVGTYSSIFVASPLLVTWRNVRGRRQRIS